MVQIHVGKKLLGTTVVGIHMGRKLLDTMLVGSHKFGKRRVGHQAATKLMTEPCKVAGPPSEMNN